MVCLGGLGNGAAPDQLEDLCKYLIGRRPPVNFLQAATRLVVLDQRFGEPAVVGESPGLWLGLVVGTCRERPVTSRHRALLAPALLLEAPSTAVTLDAVGNTAVQGL